MRSSIALFLFMFSCGTDRIVDVSDASCISFAEECNGIDDDCNGFVDDGIPVEPCYPRDNAELVPSSTECRFGISRCVAGTQRCVNWIGPSIEECNGRDDDCDGRIDEGLSNEIDIVVALDYSCSMDDRISEISEGLINWGAFRDNTGVRVALVGIPGPDPANDGAVVKIIDFTDPQTFSRSIDPLKITGGGLEPSLDAIEIMSISPTVIGLSEWNPTSGHALLVVTDEPPQTSSSQDFLASESLQLTARADAARAGLRVLIMTNQPTEWKIWPTTPFVSVPDFPSEFEKFIATGRCP